MEDSRKSSESPAKRRKFIEENPECAADGASGVVIWDIDDTIVVIQASLRLANEAYQRELVVDGFAKFLARAFAAIFVIRRLVQQLCTCLAKQPQALHSTRFRGRCGPLLPSRLRRRAT